jgi:hypothetical protein
VFSSPLHEQDFRGAKRYFVLLGRLPPDRQVGYIAVWPAGPHFVRFGIKVAPFDGAAVAALLRAAGAEVLSVTPSLIRFRDNYGITLEVVAG